MFGILDSAPVPKILVLNGSNLNMLGVREPEVYGTETLDDIRDKVMRRAEELKVEVDFRQSNFEGDIINWIHEAHTSFDGVILNPTGRTHLASGKRVGPFGGDDNGVPALSGRIAVRSASLGEAGLSYYGTTYNTFRIDGIAGQLAESGVARDKVRLLGSGQWADTRILTDQALVGGWFPAPPEEGFQTFSRKYQAAYGVAPPRNATLAYDATVLAAGLVRKFGADRFDTSVLTSPNGFAGIDGIFRFLPSGQTERRFAVYEVTGSGARLVDPAARRFVTSGGT